MSRAHSAPGLSHAKLHIFFYLSTLFIVGTPLFLKNHLHPAKSLMKLIRPTPLYCENVKAAGGGSGRRLSG